MVHSLLPLCYCLGLGMLEPELHLLDPWNADQSVLVLLAVSLGLPACVATVCSYWTTDNWSRHPLAVQLAQFNRPWIEVAASLNSEFRSVDKFVSTLGTTMVLVTDSWIVRCSQHFINLIHKRDAVLNVTSADEQRVASEELTSAQYLWIEVISINSKFKSFAIRMNSLLYAQLREKLSDQIRVARSVVIHQSLTDRFAAAFTEQVEKNGLYHLPEGSPPLEPCIGCLQKLPEVKLQKMCADLEEGPCRQCYCRPMWCTGCMGKWFASRQSQRASNVWMESTAPCPMCRATFCMADVLKLKVPT
ncbi:hypothetical protein EMCRGX_G034293 [Ephydatia muelleri]